MNQIGLDVFWQCCDRQPIKKGQEKAAVAVKVAENLIDVYIFEDRTLYYYIFRII
jgi:hypothetical protein